MRRSAIFSSSSTELAVSWPSEAMPRLARIASVWLWYFTGAACSWSRMRRAKVSASAGPLLIEITVKAFSAVRPTESSVRSVEVSSPAMRASSLPATSLPTACSISP